MVNLEHQNKPFNKLIEFINIKYSLNIQQSLLDKSSFLFPVFFLEFHSRKISRGGGGNTIE